jgi:hypothetical protein
MEIRDMETGELLQPMTLADLLRRLTPAVIRALNSLPGPIQRRLLDLPLRAQMALIDLPAPLQLQVIDALSQWGRPRIANGHGQGPATQESGALVATGRSTAMPAPGSQAKIAADLLDMLMGRGHTPDWMRGGVRVPVQRRQAAPPLMLEGSMSGSANPPPMPIFGPLRLPPSPGRGLPTFRPFELPLIRVARNHFPNRQEQLFSDIQARGLPPHRSAADASWLANHLPGLDANELLLLLHLPAQRSLSNLRALVVSKPAHRSLAFMVNLAAGNPGVSVANLVSMANLPLARTADIPPLIARKPMLISFRDWANVALALPARSVEDLVALTSLLPAKPLASIIVVGGAGPHRCGTDLVHLVQRLGARTPAEIVLLADIPARILRDLEELGNGVTATRTAAILAQLATSLSTTEPEWLLLLADLPGCTLLPARRARAICNALSRHEALLLTAARAQAALGTAHINHESGRLKTIIEARTGWTYANLMTVLTWAHFTSFDNMSRIVCNPKVDTLARLLAWLANPVVNNGNQLEAVLQNPKIQGAADVDYLLFHVTPATPGNPGVILPRYSLGDISSWITRPWADRGAAAVQKTAVNGKMLVSQIPGTGTTAGQRYSKDDDSVAWAGHICHLAMSFNSIGMPPNPVATFTGFHVSWRLPGAKDKPSDPRQFFSVNNGRVAVTDAKGGYPTGANPVATAALRAAMLAEATAMMRSYLVKLNCWM